MKVAIVMGSESDYAVAQKAQAALEGFRVEFETKVMSAHRTPDAVRDFALGARDRGFGVIIACAGKAAHLAGVIASYTTLPVVGVPVKASLDGLDALLSTVQMPTGVPVATVAIDGAENAAILAVQMLAITDAALAEKLAARKKGSGEEGE
jgi:5-(carboxyamino)imidazole ribonucleotide mutase